MQLINYNHQKNRHSIEGASEAIRRILGDHTPKSLLDVGCGPGTWLAAASQHGIQDLFGVDGVTLPEDQFLVDKRLFFEANLDFPWSVGRRFEVAICLEVAEHLKPSSATTLLATLAEHSDYIIFSAAAPHQEGQNHINCQWPDYWQTVFNKFGYRCEDTIRPKIWINEQIEWWYRQNMFVAIRDEKAAGTEPRLLPLIHPSSFGERMLVANNQYRGNIVEQIENGSERLGWYLTVPFKAAVSKIWRL